MNFIIGNELSCEMRPWPEGQAKFGNKNIFQVNVRLQGALNRNAQFIPRDAAFSCLSKAKQHEKKSSICGHRKFQIIRCVVLKMTIFFFSFYKMNSTRIAPDHTSFCTKDQYPSIIISLYIYSSHVECRCAHGWKSISFQFILH